MTGNDRRDQIEQKLEYVQKQIESLSRWLHQDAGWGSDEVDKANDLIERAEVLSLYLRLLRKRRQLENARVRLDMGLGVACEICGQQIDPARLEVIIDTTRCVTCQRRLEKRNPRACSDLGGPYG
ncbi:MAG: TraR/DksA family transcriptional regulator [Anaerolineae bacterium]